MLAALHHITSHESRCYSCSVSLQTELSFMPSVGLEFITQMGVHIPDYVDAGIQMHTNMYHESSLNAKATVNRRQVKLSIPAPQSNTQLFSVRSVTHSLSLFDRVVLFSLTSLHVLSEMQHQGAVSVIWSNNDRAMQRPDRLSRLPASVQWSEALHRSALLQSYICGSGTMFPPNRRNQVRRRSAHLS